MLYPDSLLLTTDAETPTQPLMSDPATTVNPVVGSRLAAKEFRTYDDFEKAPEKTAWTAITEVNAGYIPVVGVFYNFAQAGQDLRDIYKFKNGTIDDAGMSRILAREADEKRGVTYGYAITKTILNSMSFMGDFMAVGKIGKVAVAGAAKLGGRGTIEVGEEVAEAYVKTGLRTLAKTVRVANDPVAIKTAGQEFLNQVSDAAINLSQRSKAVLATTRDAFNTINDTGAQRALINGLDSVLSTPGKPATMQEILTAAFRQADDKNLIKYAPTVATKIAAQNAEKESAVLGYLLKDHLGEAAYSLEKFRAASEAQGALLSDMINTQVKGVIRSAFVNAPARVLADTMGVWTEARQNKLQAEIENADMSWADAFGKAGTSNYIEQFSEMTGGIFGAIVASLGKNAAVGLLKNAIYARAVKALGEEGSASAKLFLQKVAGLSDTPLARHAGFNGVLEEMAEEYAGAALRGIAPNVEMGFDPFSMQENADMFLSFVLNPLSMGMNFVGAKQEMYSEGLTKLRQTINKAKMASGGAFTRDSAEFKSVVDNLKELVSKQYKTANVGESDTRSAFYKMKDKVFASFTSDKRLAKGVVEQLDATNDQMASAALKSQTKILDTYYETLARALIQNKKIVNKAENLDVINKILDTEGGQYEVHTEKQAKLQNPDKPNFRGKTGLLNPLVAKKVIGVDKDAFLKVIREEPQLFTSGIYHGLTKDNVDTRRMTIDEALDFLTSGNAGNVDAMSEDQIYRTLQSIGYEFAPTERATGLKTILSTIKALSTSRSLDANDTITHIVQRTDRVLADTKENWIKASHGEVASDTGTAFTVRELRETGILMNPETLEGKPEDEIMYIGRPAAKQVDDNSAIELNLGYGLNLGSLVDDAIQSAVKSSGGITSKQVLEQIFNLNKRRLADAVGKQNTDIGHGTPQEIAAREVYEELKATDGMEEGELRDQQIRKHVAQYLTAVLGWHAPAVQTGQKRVKAINTGQEANQRIKEAGLLEETPDVVSAFLQDTPVGRYVARLGAPGFNVMNMKTVAATQVTALEDIAAADRLGMKATFDAKNNKYSIDFLEDEDGKPLTVAELMSSYTKWKKEVAARTPGALLEEQAVVEAKAKALEAATAIKEVIDTSEEYERAKAALADSKDEAKKKEYEAAIAKYEEAQKGQAEFDAYLEERAKEDKEVAKDPAKKIRKAFREKARKPFVNADNAVAFLNRHGVTTDASGNPSGYSDDWASIPEDERPSMIRGLYKKRGDVPEETPEKSDMGKLADIVVEDPPIQLSVEVIYAHRAYSDLEAAYKRMLADNKDLTPAERTSLLGELTDRAYHTLITKTNIEAGIDEGMLTAVEASQRVRKMRDDMLSDPVLFMIRDLASKKMFGITGDAGDVLDRDERTEMRLRSYLQMSAIADNERDWVTMFQGDLSEPAVAEFISEARANPELWRAASPAFFTEDAYAAWAKKTPERLKELVKKNAEQVEVVDQIGEVFRDYVAKKKDRYPRERIQHSLQTLLHAYPETVFSVHISPSGATSMAVANSTLSQERDALRDLIYTKLEAREMPDGRRIIRSSSEFNAIQDVLEGYEGTKKVRDSVLEQLNKKDASGLLDVLKRLGLEGINTQEIRGAVNRAKNVSIQRNGTPLERLINALIFSFGGERGDNGNGPIKVGKSRLKSRPIGMAAFNKTKYSDTDAEYFTELVKLEGGLKEAAHSLASVFTAFKLSAKPLMRDLKPTYYNAVTKKSDNGYRTGDWASRTATRWIAQQPNANAFRLASISTFGDVDSEKMSGNDIKAAMKGLYEDSGILFTPFYAGDHGYIRGLAEWVTDNTPPYETVFENRFKEVQSAISGKLIETNYTAGVKRSAVTVSQGTPLMLVQSAGGIRLGASSNVHVIAIDDVGKIGDSAALVDFDDATGLSRSSGLDSVARGLKLVISGNDQEGETTTLKFNITTLTKGTEAEDTAMYGKVRAAIKKIKDEQANWEFGQPPTVLVMSSAGIKAIAGREDLVANGIKYNSDDVSGVVAAQIPLSQILYLSNADKYSHTDEMDRIAALAKSTGIKESEIDAIRSANEDDAEMFYDALIATYPKLGNIRISQEVRDTVANSIQNRVGLQTVRRAIRDIIVTPVISAGAYETQAFTELQNVRTAIDPTRLFQLIDTVQREYPEILSGIDIAETLSTHLALDQSLTAMLDEKLSPAEFASELRSLGDTLPEGDTRSEELYAAADRLNELTKEQAVAWELKPRGNKLQSMQQISQEANNYMVAPEIGNVLVGITKQAMEENAAVLPQKLREDLLKNLFSPILAPHTEFQGIVGLWKNMPMDTEQAYTAALGMLKNLEATNSVSKKALAQARKWAKDLAKSDEVLQTAIATLKEDPKHAYAAERTKALGRYDIFDMGMLEEWIASRVRSMIMLQRDGQQSVAVPSYQLDEKTSKFMDNDQLNKALREGKHVTTPRQYVTAGAILPLISVNHGDGVRYTERIPLANISPEEIILNNPKKYRDLINDDGSVRLQELRYDANWLVIPGELIDINRVPGTLASHILARYGYRPKGSFNEMALHHSLVSPAGVDFDLDKWFAYVSGLTGSYSDRWNRALLNFYDTPDGKRFAGQGIDLETFKAQIEKAGFTEAPAQGFKLEDYINTMLQTKNPRRLLGVAVIVNSAKQYQMGTNSFDIDALAKDLAMFSHVPKWRAATPAEKRESVWLVSEFFHNNTNAILDNTSDPKVGALGYDHNTMGLITAAMYLDTYTSKQEVFDRFFEILRMFKDPNTGEYAYQQYKLKQMDAVNKATLAAVRAEGVVDILNKMSSSLFTYDSVTVRMRNSGIDLADSVGYARWFTPNARIPELPGISEAAAKRGVATDSFQANAGLFSEYMKYAFTQDELSGETASAMIEGSASPLDARNRARSMIALSGLFGNELVIERGETVVRTSAEKLIAASRFEPGKKVSSDAKGAAILGQTIALYLGDDLTKEFYARPLSDARISSLGFDFLKNLDLTLLAARKAEQWRVSSIYRRGSITDRARAKAHADFKKMPLAMQQAVLMLAISSSNSRRLADLIPAKFLKDQIIPAYERAKALWIGTSRNFNVPTHGNAPAAQNVSYAEPKTPVSIEQTAYPFKENHVARTQNLSEMNPRLVKALVSNPEKPSPWQAATVGLVNYADVAIIVTEEQSNYYDNLSKDLVSAGKIVVRVDTNNLEADLEVLRSTFTAIAETRALGEPVTSALFGQVKTGTFTGEMKKLVDAITTPSETHGFIVGVMRTFGRPGFEQYAVQAARVANLPVSIHFGNSSGPDTQFYNPEIENPKERMVEWLKELKDQYAKPSVERELQEKLTSESPIRVTDEKKTFVELTVGKSSLVRVYKTKLGNVSSVKAVDVATANIALDLEDKWLGQPVAELLSNFGTKAPVTEQPVTPQQSAPIAEQQSAQVDPDNTFNPTTFAEAQAVLESRETILSQSEARILAEKLGIKSGEPLPRILTASERTDPVWYAKHVKELVASKRFDALYIITKHDGLAIRELLQLPIPKMIHFSITTLGDTEWEPGVMKWRDLMERIEDFVKQGLDPNMVTIRVDPIVPGVTNMSEVKKLMQRSVAAGIKRVRFSVMDGYSGEIETKIRSLYGDKIDKFYDRNGSRMDAKQSVVDALAKEFLSIAEAVGIEEVGSCAEKISSGIGVKKEGCLPVSAVKEMLGLSEIDESKSKQRPLCLCFGGKVDGFKYDNTCPSSCVYCYAKHGNDKSAKYYDENGNLKTTRATLTRPTGDTSESSGVLTSSLDVSGVQAQSPAVTPQQSIPVDSFTSTSKGGQPVSVYRDPTVGWVAQLDQAATPITDEQALAYYQRSASVTLQPTTPAKLVSNAPISFKVKDTLSPLYQWNDRHKYSVPAGTTAYLIANAGEGKTATYDYIKQAQELGIFVTPDVEFKKGDVVFVSVARVNRDGHVPALDESGNFINGYERVIEALKSGATVRTDNFKQAHEGGEAKLYDRLEELGYTATDKYEFTEWRNSVPEFSVEILANAVANTVADRDYARALVRRGIIARVKGGTDPVAIADDVYNNVMMVEKGITPSLFNRAEFIAAVTKIKTPVSAPIITPERRALEEARSNERVLASTFDDETAADLGMYQTPEHELIAAYGDGKSKEETDAMENNLLGMSVGMINWQRYSSDANYVEELRLIGRKSDAKLYEEYSGMSNAVTAALYQYNTKLNELELRYGMKLGRNGKLFSYADGVQKVRSTLNRLASSVILRNSDPVEEFKEADAVMSSDDQQMVSTLLDTIGSLMDRLGDSSGFDGATSHTRMAVKQISVLKKLVEMAGGSTKTDDLVEASKLMLEEGKRFGTFVEVLFDKNKEGQVIRAIATTYLTPANVFEAFKNSDARKKLLAAGRTEEQLDPKNIFDTFREMTNSLPESISAASGGKLSIKQVEAFFPHRYSAHGIFTKAEEKLLEDRMDELKAAAPAVTPEIRTGSQIVAGELNVPVPQWPRATEWQQSVIRTLEDVLKIKGRSRFDFAQSNKVDANRTIMHLVRRLVVRGTFDSLSSKDQALVSSAYAFLEKQDKSLRISDLKYSVESSAFKERRYGSFKHAFEESGMLPAELNPVTALRKYAKSTFNSVANKTTFLRAALAQSVQGGEPLMVMIADEKLEDAAEGLLNIKVFEQMARKTMAALKLQYNEAESPHANLRRAVPELQSAKRYKRVDAPGFPFLSNVYLLRGETFWDGLGYTPYNAIKNMFQKPWTSAYPKAFQGMMVAANNLFGGKATAESVAERDLFADMMSVVQFIKFSNLALSIFFTSSAVESFTGALGFDGVGKAVLHPIKSKQRFSEIRRALVRGDYDNVHLRKLIEAGYTHDIRFEDSIVNLGEPQKLVDWLRSTKTVSKLHIREGAARVVESQLAFSNWMFGDLFAVMKAVSTIRLTEKVEHEKRVSGRGALTFEDYQKIAATMNDGFGGQNWKSFWWASPKIMQFLNLTVFAPNWTMSSARAMGGNVFMEKLGIGQQVGDIGRDFTFKTNIPTTAALVLTAWPQAVQLAVYAASRAIWGDDDEEDSPFTFGNEINKRLHVDITPIMRHMPWYVGDPSGAKRMYLSWGKQVYEVLDPEKSWVSDALNLKFGTLLGKLSAPVRLAIEMATGSQLGTNRKLDFADMGLLGLVMGKEKGLAGGMIAHAAGAALPFALSSIFQKGGLEKLPVSLLGTVSRGASPMTLQLLMTDVMRHYADSANNLKYPSAKYLLNGVSRDIVSAAIDNGYRPEAIILGAKSSVLSDLYADLFDGLESGDKSKMEHAAQGILSLGGNLKTAAQSFKNSSKKFYEQKGLTEDDVTSILEAFQIK